MANSSDGLIEASLKNKLLMRIAVIALLTGLILSFIQIVIDYRYEKQRLGEHVNELISTTQTAAAHAAWHLDEGAAQELLRGLLKHKVVYTAVLEDDLGEIIASADKTDGGLGHIPGKFIFGGNKTVVTELIIDQKTYPINSPEKMIGRLLITVDPGEIAHDFVFRSSQMLLGDLIGVSLLVALLLSVFNLTLTQPLLKLAGQLHTMDPTAPGKASVPVPKVHRKNELGNLIYNLNELLTSVQSNILKRQEAESSLKELNRELENKVIERTSELQAALDSLKDAHEQLKLSQSTILQQDKMASIGQLAAGVAHEINNPMGFITSNLGSLDNYQQKIFNYIEKLETIISDVENSEAVDDQKTQRKKFKIGLLEEDIHDLIEESLDGANRVKEIVQNLKGFSRIDQTKETDADLNDCLEKTLSIAWNEIKYKATVEKNYGEIPLIRCFPQQLNQVFLNLLVNAAHAIEDGQDGVIRIATREDEGQIAIVISDNGCGIPQENLEKLFEPFFTTKDVGQGTGLGLSIAYDIVDKHDGKLLVDSQVGKGTAFTILLPIKNGEQT